MWDWDGLLHDASWSWLPEAISRQKSELWSTKRLSKQDKHLDHYLVLVQQVEYLAPAHRSPAIAFAQP